MNEIWRDIPGFEGLYQASTFGRIRSLDIEKEYHPKNRKSYKKTLKGKVLKQFKHAEGYMVVGLYKDGKKKHKHVHRLAAITFLPNPMMNEYVKFKDGDVTNCKIDNLIWVSSSDWMIKAYKKKLEMGG